MEKKKKKKKVSSPAGLCTIRGIHCETKFNGETAEREIRRWNSSFENERLHACMAVSSVSHIRENRLLSDQGFPIREIAAKNRSFRSRAKSPRLSRTKIALTDGEKRQRIEGKVDDGMGRKVREESKTKKKERKEKERRRRRRNRK